MTLAEYQRCLKALLSGGSVPTQDSREPEIRAVAESERLGVHQSLALRWRTSLLRRFCPLTTNLLRRRGEFVPAFREFSLGHPVSPYVEELAFAFLEHRAATSSDSLERAVSAFERRLIGVRRGEHGTWRMDWPVHPYETLAALLQAEAPPPPTPGVTFEVTVSDQLPALFSVRVC